MKKIILIMFLLVLVGLQFPYYTIQNVTTSINLRSAMAMIKTVGVENAVGNLVVYIIPLLGAIASVVNIFISKNISVITAIIGLLGMMYCGFIYFFVTGLDGGIGFGFIVTFFAYLLALTISVVMVRVKEG